MKAFVSSTRYSISPWRVLGLKSLCIGILAFSALPGWAQFSVKEVADKYITAEAVKPLIVELSKDRYGGRGGGYKGERMAADYIAKEYSAIGLLPMGDATGKGRTYFQEFSFYP